VAIELTDYFNDSVAGTRSPLTPIAEFWEIVQASLIRRISHKKHLTGVQASVDFKKGLQKPENCNVLAKQLAKEIVTFVETHPVMTSQHLQFRHRHGHFNGYDTLERLLSYMFLTRRTDKAVFASRCSWSCVNISCGMIGLNLNYIRTSIANKNKKAQRYNCWNDAGEKWLLITASGRNLSNHAGPPTQKKNENWGDPELQRLCRESLFDKIVFWEISRDWHKWLKPVKG